MGNFKVDLEVGKIGEEKSLTFLKNNDKVYEVKDVRDEKFWQSHDVDFIVTMNLGDIIKIEVKTDTLAHITGNIAYEHTSNKYSGSLGCFRKTKADFIFYYLSQVDKLYQINTCLLREYIDNHNFNNINMGDMALGYLIKIDLLEKNEIMKEIKIN